MALNTVLEALGNSGFGTAVAQSTWMFPTAETIHVITIALVVGTVLVADLRMLGWADRNYTLDSILSATIPWTWGAFALAVLSGLVMFSSAPTSYVENTFFIVKFVLMGFAGLNMLLFHRVILRRHHATDTAMASPVEPKGARWAGGLSLMLWIGIVVAARWIGFTSFAY